jgi:hypothetical protein
LVAASEIQGTISEHSIINSICNRRSPSPLSPSHTLKLYRYCGILLDRDDAIELAWKRYWRGLEAIDCGR